MSRLSRMRVRAGRAFQDGLARFSRSANVLAVVAVVVVLVFLVWLGVTSSNAGNGTRGLLPLLQDQAASLLTVALLGLVAWVGFRWRFRQAKSRYLRPFRVAPAPDVIRRITADQQTLLRTVIDQLVARRPPRSLLVVSAAGASPPDLASLLASWVVERGLTPVVVDVGQCDESARIPALSRESFVGRVVGSSGDEPRANRLFVQEAERGKIVVLVVGLEHVVESKSRLMRRLAIRTLLRTCLDEGLPFIAPVPDELAPDLSEVAVVRVRQTFTREEFRAQLHELLRRRGVPLNTAVRAAVNDVFGGEEVTSDPWYLEVAADLVLNRVRAGQEPADAIRELASIEPQYLRRVSWLSERALGCRLEDAAGQITPVARVLGLIGRQALFRQDVAIHWSDLTGGLDLEEELNFAAATSLLIRREILVVGGDDPADPSVRFAHPSWLAFAGALGVGSDESRWAQLLTVGAPQATLDALTCALVMHGGGGSRSFLAELSRLKEGDLRDVTLDMVLAVVRALQVGVEPLEIGAVEVEVLRRAWRAAPDQAKLLFVDSVDPHERMAVFLWEQVVPPRFGEHSYRLRREICWRLAGMGPVAWRALSDEWARLLVEAASADLSASARLTRDDWLRVGLPLASAAWLLPLLALRLSGTDRAAAVATIAEIRRVFGRAGRPDGQPLPDPGLEISLAEGFKLASASAGSGYLHGSEDAWLVEAKRSLLEAKSWTSRQVLYQSLALIELRNPGVASALPENATDTHPFVRESIALAQRALAHGRQDDADPSASGGVGRDIWLDDVQSLSDGGFGLSPQAHRLLGLSTFLINLAEGAHQQASQPASGETLSRADARAVESREMALTFSALPRCFSSSSHTVTMLDTRCDCPFGLCGPNSRGTIGARQISTAFGQRAEVTASGPPAWDGSRAFVRRPFRQVWKRPEMVTEEPPAP